MTSHKTIQIRRRLVVDSTLSQHMEMSMLQQVVPRQDNYTQSPATALQNVESTISELGGIFTQLATMVAHQDELAIRFLSPLVFALPWYLHASILLASTAWALWDVTEPNFL